MTVDKFGQIILTEQEICEIFLQNPEAQPGTILTSDSVEFSGELDLQYIPNLTKYVEPEVTLEEFDNYNRSQWHMPAEYAELDIAKWILDQCNTDAERQRVGEELLLYLDRDMFPLLQYLKYLVDTMRKYNIVWGVGRGSSVSSYVLYIIGVHKINSLYYGLDIHEFLR